MKLETCNVNKKETEFVILFVFVQCKSCNMYNILHIRWIESGSV